MNPQMPISLVVFDLGRVLIRICDGWRHACEVAGITVPAARALTPQSRATVDDICARYDSGVIDLECFAGELGPIFGQSPEHVIAVQQVYLQGPYPGAADLIDDLSRAGVKTACLSNTAEPHWRMMNDPRGPNFLPLHRLTWRFASFLLGCRKPQEAIYQRVERETRIAGPSIVFFDDVEENVAAAARRGWRAHQIRIDADPIAQARRQLAAYGLIGRNGRESL